MSSPAAASTLALPPAKGAVRVIAQADDLTVVVALSEMDSPAAAALMMALDDEKRMVKLLAQMPPVTVAGILRNVVPPSRRQDLLDKLPGQFRDLAIKHL